MNMTVILAIYLSGIAAGVVLINLNKILVLPSYSQGYADNPVHLRSGSGFLSRSKEIFSSNADFSIRTLILVNINAFAWIVAGYVYEMSLKLVVIAILITIALLISLTDISVRKIPNFYVSLIGTVGIASIFTGLFNISVGMHIGGFIAGGLIFIVPFLLNQGIGAGDVKFLAVAGLVLGFENILIAIMVMGISIVVFITGMVIVRKNFRDTMKLHIPLGPFISIGFAAGLLASNI